MRCGRGFGRFLLVAKFGRSAGPGEFCTAVLLFGSGVGSGGGLEGGKDGPATIGAVGVGPEPWGGRLMVKNGGRFLRVGGRAEEWREGRNAVRGGG